MPRPRRKPRPPGNAVVVCTGRGSHGPKHIRRLQLAVDGDRAVIKWDRRQGPAPVTGAMSEDGRRTFELRCPACPVHWKRNEGDLVKIVLALAGMQGISGDDNTPITLDVSRLVRA